MIKRNFILMIALIGVMSTQDEAYAADESIGIQPQEMDERLAAEQNELNYYAREKKVDEEVKQAREALKQAQEALKQAEEKSKAFYRNDKTSTPTGAQTKAGGIVEQQTNELNYYNTKKQAQDLKKAQDLRQPAEKEKADREIFKKIQQETLNPQNQNPPQMTWEEALKQAEEKAKAEAQKQAEEYRPATWPASGIEYGRRAGRNPHRRASCQEQLVSAPSDSGLAANSPPRLETLGSRRRFTTVSTGH